MAWRDKIPSFRKPLHSPGVRTEAPSLLCPCLPSPAPPLCCRCDSRPVGRVRLFATPWAVARQAPLSMEFSRQEYWSGSPFPSPGDLSTPGIQPGSLALQADSLPSERPGELTPPQEALRSSVWLSPPVLAVGPVTPCAGRWSWLPWGSATPSDLKLPVYGRPVLFFWPL